MKEDKVMRGYVTTLQENGYVREAWDLQREMRENRDYLETVNPKHPDDHFSRRRI